MALQDKESVLKPFKPQRFEPFDSSISKAIEGGNVATNTGAKGINITTPAASNLTPKNTVAYSNPETGNISKAKKAEPVEVPPSDPPFSYDSDYQALLTYATNQGYTLPSFAQKQLQNDLVIALKNANIWSQLDLFYVFATDGDVNFASLNWRFPNSYKVDPKNNPTFTSNVGFTGNGTDAYLDTGWNAGLGLNYKQKFASHGVFTNSHRGEDEGTSIGYHGGGSGGVYSILNYYDASPGFDGFYINTASARNLTRSRNTNFRAATFGENNFGRYVQRSYRGQTYDESDPLTGPVGNGRIYIMQRGVTGTEWYAPSSIEFKADFWGGYLEEYQIETLYKSLESYVNAL